MNMLEHYNTVTLIAYSSAILERNEIWKGYSVISLVFAFVRSVHELTVKACHMGKVVTKHQ